MSDYKGNANMPIVAFDFDGVVVVNSEGDNFPYIPDECEHKEIHRLMDFLHDLGVTVGIWTCRENEARDAMEEWLDKHDYDIDFINDTYEFAPYGYNPRKIFAHLYVDDRGYGWHGNNSTASILQYFLKYTCRTKSHSFSSRAIKECVDAFTACEPPEEWMKEGIKNWWKD